MRAAKIMGTGCEEPNPFLSEAVRAQWKAVCLGHNKVVVRQSPTGPSEAPGPEQYDGPWFSEHVEQARMGELTAAVASPLPTVTGAGVIATDVGNLRLALMALLPNISGLVLCFGMALRQ